MKNRHIYTQSSRHILIFIFLTLLYSTLLSKVITIAGTADLQGKMESSVEDNISVGGISHLSTLFKSLKKDNPNTIIVSTGDDLMNRFFHMYKGKAILSLMGNAGYDLYIFGNHEFDKGSEVLAKAIEKSSMQALCSDLDVSQSKLNGKCLPYLIKKIDAIHVGFFSLMTEELALVTS